MKKANKKQSLWLWILLLGIIVGIVSYFVIFELGKKTKKTPSPEKVTTEEKPSLGTKPSAEMKALEEKEKGIEKTEVLVKEGRDIPEKERPSEKKPTPEPLMEDDCTQTRKNVASFFQYIDQKPYAEHQTNQSNAYGRFRKILGKLSSNLPLPAGEGIDSRLIIKNIYHLYRILDRNDVKLIKDVLSHERDTMELNMAMFYEWLMPNKSCPDPDRVRPPLPVLYHYAGFFINTTGGRAYLFRRALEYRLLMTYYGLLIIHEADKRGKNTYGIDILPYIDPLREEILHYPHFQFKDEYMEKLDILEIYYRQRR